MSNGSRPDLPIAYRFCRDASAQTETMGAVLLLGITVFGAVGIVAFGSTALNDTERTMEIQSAEHTMTQMDAHFAEVALGKSSAKVAQLPRSDEQASTKVVDDGWIKMEVVNKSTGNVEETIFNKSLGAVVYENDGTVIAYQGGGVWKKTGGNSTMVSPPEFHFRGETLTLPVIQIQGGGQVDGDVTVKKNGTSEQLYPDDDHDNPFTGENTTISVTVKSEYYEAWGNYFETRTEGKAFLDHGDETVTLELVAELKEHKVDSGIASTSASGALEFSGTGAYTDSYNSTVGNYSVSQSWNGTIVAGGNVEVSGNAELRGNVKTGSSFILDNNAADVHGDIYYDDTADIHPSNSINGSLYSPANVDSPGAIDGHVDERVNATQDSNDNGNVSVIDSDDRLDFSGGADELTAGDYYLKDFTVPDGETLELNTTDGNITIGVRDYIDVEGTVNVTGDGRVQVYVRGEDTVTFNAGGGKSRGVHFRLKGGTVDVGDDDDAAQLWIYGKQYFDASFDKAGSDDAVFHGVIYAPTSLSGNNLGHVEIHDAAIYGGIMAGSTDVNQNGELHFDQALEGQQAVPEDTTVVLVNYLHVTINVVEVED